MRHSKMRSFFCHHTFPRFLVVGTIGFIVDAGLLALLHYHFEIDLLIARLCSFNIAILSTWTINRLTTFRANASPRLFSEYSRYLLINIAGGLINLTVFVALTHYTMGFVALPLPALAIASAIALLFNYSGSRLYVFNHQTQTGQSKYQRSYTP